MSGYTPHLFSANSEAGEKYYSRLRLEPNDTALRTGWQGVAGVDKQP